MPGGTFVNGQVPTLAQVNAWLTSVATADIADGAVTTIKLVDGSVTTVKIADLGVTLAKLASDSVNASKIVDGSVGAAELASDAVTTVKILDANVTLAKLAADSVNASKIVDGSVGTAELAANSVDASKIADASVTAAKLAAQPSARVFHSISQSVANTTLTVAAFDSEHFDTDTIHDTATNNSRLTCKTAGRYIIIANIRYSPNVTGDRYAQIRLNGTTVLGYELCRAAATADTMLLVSTLDSLAVNDYVEVIAYQDSGVSLNLTSDATFSPKFMMIRVGA